MFKNSCINMLGYLCGVVARNIGYYTEDFKKGYVEGRIKLDNHSVAKEEISGMDKFLLSMLTEKHGRNQSSLIWAIKHLRNETGKPLKESKDYVEALITKHKLSRIVDEENCVYYSYS